MGVECEDVGPALLERLSDDVAGQRAKLPRLATVGLQISIELDNVD